MGPYQNMGEVIEGSPWEYVWVGFVLLFGWGMFFPVHAAVIAFLIFKVGEKCGTGLKR